MNAFVMTLTGKTFFLDLEKAVTTLDLKKMIEDVDGTPPRRQRLIHTHAVKAGKWMSGELGGMGDDQRLEDWGLRSGGLLPGDVVFLAVRLCN